MKQQQQNEHYIHNNHFKLIIFVFEKYMRNIVFINYISLYLTNKLKLFI